MDREKSKVNRPFYNKIYNDILNKKFPDKIKECRSILIKEDLSFLDIIQLNKKIFGHQDEFDNQRLRSYSLEAVFKILEYQKKNELNNTQLAVHFKLSRNTIAKWKKCFRV